MLPLLASALLAAAPALVDADLARVRAEVRRPGASAVVVNLWATWCKPCVEEFPHLLRLRSEMAPRGVRVLLVSGDFPDEREQVVSFLKRQGVSFETYLKSGPDDAFIDGMDPRWSGALPATFVYDGEGRLRSFWEGGAPYARFEEAVRTILDSNPRAERPDQENPK